MNNKHIKYKTCERKVRYATKNDAISAALLKHQRLYKCQFCGGYHLSKAFTRGGSKDPRVVYRDRVW